MIAARQWVIAGSLVVSGMFFGNLLTAATQRAAPAEHSGISATSLGVVDSVSMQNTLGLEGYKLQLRQINLAPGGKIAKHDHGKRPGLVWMLEGSWVEGRDSGEVAYTAGKEQSSIVEDENTVHWFFNDSDKTSSAIVCDIVPAE